VTESKVGFCVMAAFEIQDGRHAVLCDNGSYQKWTGYEINNTRNKKFGLMLTRRAKAYNSFCSQTVSLSPAISSRLLRGYRSLMPSRADYFEPRKLRLGPSTSTFNAENFMCSLSMSISIGFGAIYLWTMCLAAQNCQKCIKTPILAFKVIQGHWIRWQSRASVRLPISD